MSKVEYIAEHERARLAALVPSLISGADIRDPADYRTLYVLGFGIAGAIVTNALVFIYFALFYASG